MARRTTWLNLIFSPPAVLAVVVVFLGVGFARNAWTAWRYLTTLYPDAAHPYDYYAEAYLTGVFLVGILLLLMLRDRENPVMRHKTGLAPFVWRQLRGRAKRRFRTGSMRRRTRQRGGRSG
jgi:hypothetical protein